MKLALGTVQFGLDYGVNNQRGQIPAKEVFSILELALNNNIDTLDTAHAYGNSERIIGDFIKACGKSFKIISKVPEIRDDENINTYFLQSLDNLRQQKLYAYLFHNFESFRMRVALLEDVKKLKLEGKVQKIGFSLYYPLELEYLLKNEIAFDIVQLPYSVFDQRFDKYLKVLKDKNVEVHTRSVFLQGLVFKKPENIDSNLEPIKDQIIYLRKISRETGLSISALCLNFAVLNENIDKVVIGVDCLDNFRENLIDLREDIKNKTHSVYSQLRELRIDDEKLILPTNWK